MDRLWVTFFEGDGDGANMNAFMVRDTAYDAVIVGGGATGGWAAKLLTEGGLTVALVEAGIATKATDVNGISENRGASFGPPSQTVVSRRPIQSRCYACREPYHEWFVDDKDNPYVEVFPFSWIRMRVLGGRLLAWEGQSYRMSDLDFKAYDHDGVGENWPLSYRDLEMHYDSAEAYLGVSGVDECMAHLPAGLLEQPIGRNVTCQILKEALELEFDRVVTPARVASMAGSRRFVKESEPKASESMDARGLAPGWSAIGDACATGHLHIFLETVATRIRTVRGKAVGLSCVRRDSNEMKYIAARVVILCASTLESTRLILNSDVCSSSGVLGHYLMDHVFGGGASGTTQVSWSDFHSPGYQRHRAYIPRFRNVGDDVQSAYKRGYGIQAKSIALASSGLWARLFQRGSGRISVRTILAAFGECLARYDNSVQLDREHLDRWGVPTLRIKAQWSDNELMLMKDAQEQSILMLKSAGVKDITANNYISTPGLAIHEVGTARMGTNPKTSVVNRFCQCHDLPNLFVMDGACWVSSGCQNPTLTMLAIAGHSCQYILKEFREGLGDS